MADAYTNSNVRYVVETGGAEIEAMLQKPYVAAVYTDQTE